MGHIPKSENKKRGWAGRCHRGQSLVPCGSAVRGGKDYLTWNVRKAKFQKSSGQLWVNRLLGPRLKWPSL